jgi:hypothetical protein
MLFGTGFATRDIKEVRDANPVPTFSIVFTKVR